MPERSEMARRQVVHELPGMDAVQPSRDLEFAGSDSAPLAFDLYRPRGSEAQQPLPAVVFASGYPDPGFEAVFGCRFKEMGAYVCWARLVAVSGLAAITATNREPVADLAALLRHLRREGEALGVDASRIGVWACSGNAPAALSLLMGKHAAQIRCAAFSYGYMLDLHGSTQVADAAASFGFANPCAGRSLADLPTDLPLLLVRAGRDEMPGLNESIDAFVRGACARNLPLTLINHPTAPHAFDLTDPSALTGEVIERILGFLRFWLTT